jgi:phosphocarrier protein HPr
MTSCSVSIINPLGLHARAAAKFVHVASGFASAIRVGRGGREMDGKSIMGLLLLSAAQGTSEVISADGSDETEAIAALCALVDRGFDEAPFDTAHGVPFGRAQDKP